MVVNTDLVGLSGRFPQLFQTRSLEVRRRRMSATPAIVMSAAKAIKVLLLEPVAGKLVDATLVAGAAVVVVVVVAGISARTTTMFPTLATPTNLLAP